MNATKKKMIVAIALTLLTALTFSYGTYAYFTDSASSGISIRSGSVRLALHDSTLSASGTLLPGSEPVAIMPGTQVGKSVTIKNAGELSAFIRVKASPTVTLGDENLGRESEIDLSLISLAIDPTVWIEQDGYWYYHRALRSGEWSESVYSAIIFSPEMDGLYMNSTVLFTLDVQAVQVTANSTDPLTATGWPAETGGAL